MGYVVPVGIESRRGDSARQVVGGQRLIGGYVNFRCQWRSVEDGHFILPRRSGSRIIRRGNHTPPYFTLDGIVRVNGVSGHSFLQHAIPVPLIGIGYLVAVGIEAWRGDGTDEVVGGQRLIGCHVNSRRCWYTVENFGIILIRRSIRVEVSRSDLASPCIPLDR